MTKKEPKEIKVTILRNTFCAGKPLEVGKTVTVKAEDAKALIAAGKAAETEKVTSEQKEAMEVEEIRLKAKEKRKAELKPSQMANTGVLVAKNAAKKDGGKKDGGDK